jgi:GH24 family phage-related lysozyme (muramidase)
MSPRIVTPTGQKLIAEFEALRLAGYWDAAKPPVATIGWGHTEAAGGEIRYEDGTVTTRVIIGKRITEDEARRLKERDLGLFASGVERLLKRSPARWQFDAMVSLAYNIGTGAFARSSVLRQFNAGADAKAAEAFLLWIKSGGRVLNGLVRRRNAERALFMGDVDLASKFTQAKLPPYSGGFPSPAETQEAPPPVVIADGVKPDEPGTPPMQSTTIWSQIAAVLTTIGTAAAQAFGAIDWKTAAVMTAGGVAVFAIYTISERMRHAKEHGA